MSTLVWIFYVFSYVFRFPINITALNFLLLFACVECSLRRLEIFYFDQFFARKFLESFIKNIRS